MPSLFRLYLDHDGISLRRIGASEAELSTTLDAPDFETRLAEMRELIAAETAKAAGGEPDTAPTEVVLPDSQILYTEVAASGLDDVADAARVRAGLVGATPYDLDELLWDWRLDGKVLRIAVVARETLAEAQQFAAAQGFDPTAYLGNPDEDVFPGHPRFGGTAAESAPPDAASALMRDAAQAASAEGDTPESGEPAETSPADPAPLQTAERPVDPEPAPNADMAPTDASATPAENPSPEAAPAGGASGADAPAVPAPVSDNKTAHDAEPAEVAGKGDDSAEAETSPESTVSAEAAAEASESTAPPGAESDGPAETPPAPDTVAAAPFVSLRAARDGADAERTSPVVPASATPEQPTPPKAPARRGLSRLRATASEPKPAKRKDAPSPVASKPVGKQNAGKPNTGKQKVDKQTSVSLADTSQTHDLPPPSNTPKLSTLANASAPETLPPRGKREIRRRSTGLVVPAPAASAPSKEGALNEAESLTVFGARRTESGRGGPRYLGLTLTIGLLAVMGVVALWSLYVEDRGEQAVASLPPATAPSEDASNVAQAIEQTEPEGAIEGADALASTEAAAPPAPTATEPTEIPPAASGQTAEDATDPAPAITPLPEDPTPSTEDVARAQPVETPESPQGADSTSAPVAPAQSVEGTSVAEAPAAPSVAPSTAADVPLGDAATPPPVAQPDAPDADTAEAAPAETAPTALPSTPAPAPSADVAATEVLTDTPTSPLAPGASEEPPLTTRALTPPGGPTPAPVRLPDGRLAEADRRDALPTAPVNPLPAGSYLGPDGLVVPLPEGALAPGGYVLFTGRPPIVPPARPSADAPAPTALPDTQDDASLAPGAQTETPEAADPLAVADAAVAPLDPLQDARPLPRPADADAEASASLPVPDAGSQDADGEAVATDISADPSPADEAGSAETVAQPPLAPPATRDAPAEAVLAALSGALAPETTEEALPAPQPADPEPTALPSAPDAEETAAPFAAEADPTSPDLGDTSTDTADPSLAGLRPRGRPEALEAQAAALLEEAARAAAVAQEEAAAAAAAAAEAEAQRLADLASASALAVAAAPGPRARPTNIAQIAARAQRSTADAQAQQATASAALTPEAARPTAAQPEAPAPSAGAPSASAPSASAQAAAASAAAAPAPNAPIIRRSDRIQPAQPSSALVARQATQRNALRLNRVTLIGVYGSASQRRALVRLPSGRYVKVQVGDRLDGGRVSAISRTELQYTKSGRAVTIEMPSS